MRFGKRKFLSCILAFSMILPVAPATVLAAPEPVTVSAWDDLLEAIDAIPEGGSGEITINGLNVEYDAGINIVGKDITFNLVNSHISTGADGTGHSNPVIVGVNANITINADGDSSMYTCGETDLGIIKITNNTYDETASAFTENFTLTINGGRYTCTEGSNLFSAVSGTEFVLTDVACNGKIEAVNDEDTVPGKITVNSGKFSNDVEEYAADGKYFCSFGESYYVRDKEFSDDFSKVLTNGKLVFNYVRPSADNEDIWLIAEDFYFANPDFYLDPGSFSEDFSKLDLGIFYGTGSEEFHTVDVVWDYDEAVLQEAQSFIEKFPEDRPWFDVSDLELVNYWVYHNPDSEVDSLANYSGELKSILGNSNFLLNIDARAGADDSFYTMRIATAKLIHGDKVYFVSGYLGAMAEHAIYVPESTADTKEALIAAAQKRIDDYIGGNVVKITASDETVTDYYNSTIAGYDSRLAAAQSELVAARAAREAEMSKDESLWDWNIISQSDLKIMECEQEIQRIPGYKQFFIERFNEGGDLYFLTKAAGDYFFNVEVVGKDEEYSFVIIKDDAKLAVPSYASVDLNTKVSVTTDSSTVPLDTIIEVEKLTGGAEYNRIIEVLDVEENETFDIKLHSGSLDNYFTKLEDGRFEVKIPVPERFKGKTLIVYYVDRNNKPVEYEVTVKDNYAVFTTDHFSIYTLAEKSEDVQGSTPENASGEAQTDGGTSSTPQTGEGTSSTPQTGENSNLWLCMLLVFISGVLLPVTIALRKKKEFE